MHVKMFSLCALALLVAVDAQSGIDCELSDLFSGGTLERLIVDATLIGDSVEPTEATVLHNRTVCLSVGNTRGKFSSISLLIDFECRGSLQCPSRATEQFNFGCKRGQWSVEQLATPEYARHTNSLAYYTDLRTDCRLCFTMFVLPNHILDDFTHCQGRPHKSV